MTEESSAFLIAGLGNPGKAYTGTRHNAGFLVVRRFAEKQGWAFRKVPEMHAEMAQGIFEGKKVLLLLPMTYMNSSGESIGVCIAYFKLLLTQVMVVCDDIAIPFGCLKIKTCGSSGGHNGLKSIESHLGTQAYARLKVGVGDREHGDLSDYVLAPFSKEESEKLQDIIERAVLGLECFLSKGIVQAMHIANACQEEKKPEKNVGE